MQVVPNNSNIVQQESGFVKGFLHLFSEFPEDKERTGNPMRSEFLLRTDPYTSSMTAISAASPRRAPVRVTLV